jgi:hypothetical protein
MMTILAGDYCIVSVCFNNLLGHLGDNNYYDCSFRWMMFDFEIALSLSLSQGLAY